MAAHLANLLQKLCLGQDRLEYLQEIKTTIYSIQINELKTFVRNVSFEPVFASFNTKNRTELELTRDILSRLLDCIEPDVVLAQFRDEIYSGMGHPEEGIRCLCLHQIERLSKSEDGMNNLKNDSDLLENVITIVGDDSLSVAKMAIQILTTVGTTQNGCRLLFSGSLKDKIFSVAKINETVRYRIFEIATIVSKSTPDHLHIVDGCGLLQWLFEDVRSDDDLIQLNAVEMLCTLADCQHGVMYLDQANVISSLETILIRAESDPYQGFLLPELIKFFGCISCHQPKEVSEKHPAFINVSFNLMKNSEMALLNIAVDTIGFLGSSSPGKRVLHKQGPAMTEALSILGRLIQVPPTEVRVRALSALASLFAIQTDEINEDLEIMLEEWFTHISEKPIDLILSLCKQPFLDIRCPAFSILRALANQKWAQLQLHASPGFQEFLLDRSTEHEKESKEAKYDAVRELSNASYTADVFGRPYLLKLKEFVRDGPFYIQTQSEVAMEGAA